MAKQWYQRSAETAGSSQPRSGMAWYIWLLLAALLILVGGRFALDGMARVLMIDEAPHEADAILVLGGGTGSRQDRGMELYAEGLAPWMVSSGETQDALGDIRSYAQMGAEYMMSQGIPQSAILLLDRVTSTRDEAVAARALCEERGWTSLLVVTDHYHTGRTRLTFRKALRGTGISATIVSADPPWFDMRRWWSDERSLLAVFEEYVKLALYLVRGYII